MVDGRPQWQRTPAPQAKEYKVERGTGTICARGIFDNSSRKLTPGLFVRVRVPFGKPHQVLLVPERAIARDQKLKFLWTVDKDNVVHRCGVEVGSLQKDLRVITSGLKPDDRVIVKGLQRVRQSGDLVTPHDDEDAGPATTQGGSASASGTIAAKAK